MNKISFEYNGETVELNVVEHVGWYKEDAIIRGVIDMCYQDGEYYPAHQDWGTEFMLLCGFTDVDASRFNLEQWHEILDTTDVMNDLRKSINWRQNIRIVDSVKEGVAARNAEHPLRGLGNALKGFLEKNGNVIRELLENEEARKEIQEAAKSDDGKAVIDFLNTILNATPKK